METKAVMRVREVGAQERERESMKIQKCYLSGLESVRDCRLMAEWNDMRERERERERERVEQ